MVDILSNETELSLQFLVSQSAKGKLLFVNYSIRKHVKGLWDSAQCLTYSTNYFQQLTLESWYTNLEQTPLKRCQLLPAPYKDLKPTDLTNNRRIKTHQ